MAVKRISNAEWGLFIGALGMVDLLQFILDIFLIGVVANRFIDIVVGMGIIFYCWMRGIRLDSKKLFTTIGAFVGEEFPGLDAAPFWIGDGFAIMAFHKADEKLS